MLFVLVEIGQLVGRLIRFLVRQLNRVAPPRVSAVVVVVLLLALTIALLNGVVVRFAMRSLNNTFATVNDEMDPDTAAPTTRLRSGGPGVAGQLGVAGASGPHLRGQRHDRREALRSSTAPRRRSRSARTPG